MFVCIGFISLNAALHGPYGPGLNGTERGRTVYILKSGVYFPYRSGGKKKKKKKPNRTEPNRTAISTKSFIYIFCAYGYDANSVEKCLNKNYAQVAWNKRRNMLGKTWTIFYHAGITMNAIALVT